jgi:hypothetical protein
MSDQAAFRTLQGRLSFDFHLGMLRKKKQINKHKDQDAKATMCISVSYLFLLLIYIKYLNNVYILIISGLIKIKNQYAIIVQSMSLL